MVPASCRPEFVRSLDNIVKLRKDAITKSAKAAAEAEEAAWALSSESSSTTLAVEVSVVNKLGLAVTDGLVVKGFAKEGQGSSFTRQGLQSGGRFRLRSIGPAATPPQSQQPLAASNVSCVGDVKTSLDARKKNNEATATLFFDSL